MRLGRQAGVHGLRRGPRRQRPERAVQLPHRPRPRGGRRRRRARSGHDGHRGRRPVSCSIPGSRVCPRGIDPICGSCEAGDLSLCWHFTDGDLAPGHPHRNLSRRPRGFRRVSARPRDDGPPRPGRGSRRARRHGRPFLCVTSLRDPAPTAASRARSRLRGGRARDDCDRDTSRAVSRSGGRRRRRPPHPGRSGAQPRGDGLRARARRLAHRRGGCVVGRQVEAGRRRPSDGASRWYRRRLRHDRDARPHPKSP